MSPISPSLLSIIGTLFFLSSGGHSLDQSFSLFESLKKNRQPEAFTLNHQILCLETLSAPAEQVTITDLLANSQDYHQQLVLVRGRIIQPELHLDETELYVDFVFRLSQADHSLVVYGRHDRTQSAPPIIINRSVEVIGIFWKEQDRNGMTIFNALEAFSVTPYPSSTPESA